MPIVVKAGIERALLPGFRRLKSFFPISTLAVPDKLAIAFCLAAVAFLLSGNLLHINRARLQVASLSAFDPNEPLISGTGFASDAVYPTTVLPSFQGGVKFFGSWLGSNTPTGSVHSPWYRPVSQFYFFVAGYPNHPGNQLIAEIQTAHSGIVRIPISPPYEPAEAWRLNKVSLPGVQQAVKFRIIAIDGSTNFWLGFSQPFLIGRGDYLRLLQQLLLVILATAASIVFFLSPGLVLRQKLLQSSGRHLAFIWLPFPSLLGLALLGLASC